MLWWAYAGLSGSIVVSISSLALLMGMPFDGVARLTITTLVAFLIAGLLVHGFAGVIARSLRPKQAKPAAPVPVDQLLSQAFAQAAGKPASIAPSQRRSGALAGLRPTPEHS